MAYTDPMPSLPGQIGSDGLSAVARTEGRHAWLWVLWLAWMLGGAPGCSSAPNTAVPLPVARGVGSGERALRQTVIDHPAVAVARDLVGAPYRYGGATPDGFDCSGLVYYAYAKAGIRVPRTSTEQYRRALPVRVAELRAGDLLFFRLYPPKVSHVGIYAGEGRFIHAPSRGKRVTTANLASPYWRERLVGAGRF